MDPINVVWSKADQMFQDILNCCSTDRLPRYKGDLELINHSAGSLTSEAYQKRWMRKNELLADAAEKASIASRVVGRPRVSARPVEWRMDPGDGRTVPRSAAGHRDAESV